MEFAYPAALRIHGGCSHDALVSYLKVKFGAEVSSVLPFDYLKWGPKDEYAGHWAWCVRLDEHTPPDLERFDMLPITTESVRAITGVLRQMIAEAAQSGTTYEPKNAHLDQSWVEHLEAEYRADPELFNDVSMVEIPGLISRKLAAATLDACCEALSDTEMSRRKIAVKLRGLFVALIAPRISKEKFGEWLERAGSRITAVNPVAYPVHTIVSELMNASERNESIVGLLDIFGVRPYHFLIRLKGVTAHPAFARLENTELYSSGRDFHWLKEEDDMKHAWTGCIWSRDESGARDEMVFEMDERFIALEITTAKAELWAAYVLHLVVEHVGANDGLCGFSTPSIMGYDIVVEDRG